MCVLLLGSSGSQAAAAALPTNPSPTACHRSSPAALNPHRQSKAAKQPHLADALGRLLVGLQLLAKLLKEHRLRRLEVLLRRGDVRLHPLVEEARRLLLRDEPVVGPRVHGREVDVLDVRVVDEVLAHLDAPLAGVGREQVGRRRAVKALRADRDHVVGVDLADERRHLLEPALLCSFWDVLLLCCCCVSVCCGGVCCRRVGAGQEAPGPQTTQNGDFNSPVCCTSQEHTQQHTAQHQHAARRQTAAKPSSKKSAPRARARAAPACATGSPRSPA